MPKQILSPIHKANRQAELHLTPQLDRLRLTDIEGHILSFLAAYAPRPTGELARVFNLKPSTATSMLDRLEHGGYIVRAPGDDDKRVLFVQLAPKGAKAAAAVDEIAFAFERAVLAKVSESDLAGFRAVIDAIDAVTHIEVRAKS